MDWNLLIGVTLFWVLFSSGPWYQTLERILVTYLVLWGFKKWLLPMMAELFIKIVVQFLSALFSSF